MYMKVIRMIVNLKKKNGRFAVGNSAEIIQKSLMM